MIFPEMDWNSCHGIPLSNNLPVYGPEQTAERKEGEMT